MKNTFELQKKAYGICLIAFLFLMSVTAAKAQESLRDAIDFDGDNKADPIVARPENNT